MARITLVADLHVGARDERADLSDLVQQVNVSNPDAVFVLGDVIHETGSYDDDMENLTYVLDRFDDVDARSYFLPGNHDANTFGRVTWEKVTGTTLNEVADLGDEYVTMIDSAFDRQVEHTGFLGEQALFAIEHTMQYDPTPIVLSHFPLTYSDIYQHSDWFGDYPEGVFPADKKKVLELDETPGVVFCGHLHLDTMYTWWSEDTWNACLPPYTQFESIDDPVHNGFTITIDTENVRDIDV